MAGRFGRYLLLDYVFFYQLFFVILWKLWGSSFLCGVWCRSRNGSLLRYFRACFCPLYVPVFLVVYVASEGMQKQVDSIVISFYNEAKGKIYRKKR